MLAEHGDHHTLDGDGYRLALSLVLPSFSLPLPSLPFYFILVLVC